MINKKMSKRKVGLFFIVITVFLLQACQHDIEVKQEKKITAQKISDAASYNTQLGMAYLNQGNRPRAKRKLLTALKLAPSSPDVNAAMAYYLEKTGDKEEAQTFYNKALSLAPDSGAQLNNYGTFLCRSGNYLEAEHYFLKAVRDVHYLHSAGAYENAGLCAMAIPDEKKAVAYFNKALEQDHQRKQSLLELVTLSLKKNNPDEALNYLQKYPEATLKDSILLGLALDASHKAGKKEAEADYKQRLSQLNNKTDYTGEENEYDSAIG